MSSSILVPHGFFTRQNGVSRGDFTSLNCGLNTKDLPKNVQENQQRVTAHFNLPLQSLVTLQQVHSDKVIVVDRPLDKRLEADALVTKTPGLALGILTADCAPVLFVDSSAGIIGAAHAGWRGAFGGVLENTIEAMESLGADPGNIAASIGPCIAHESYEVDQKFYQAFLNKDQHNSYYFIQSNRNNHYYFDLKQFIANALRLVGIKVIDCLPEDTYTQSDVFFSHRRACHEGRSDEGRQISVICLP